MPDKLIMLLEDQPLISLDIEDALAEHGFRDVATFRSQRDAVDFLETATPDFVLLDLYLNDGDSRPVLEVLKKKRVRFAIYSGSPKPSEWDQSLFAGCDWMEKPLDPATLVKLIDERLQEA